MYEEVDPNVPQCMVLYNASRRFREREFEALVTIADLGDVVNMLDKAADATKAIHRQIQEMVHVINRTRTTVLNQDEFIRDKESLYGVASERRHGVHSLSFSLACHGPSQACDSSVCAVHPRLGSCRLRIWG